MIGARHRLVGKSLRERLAADPQVVGRIVRLDGEPYTIRGVTADAVASRIARRARGCPPGDAPGGNN